MIDKDFLSPELKKDNLDRYYIRTVILEKINLNLKKFKGILLDIGCGKMPYREYILNNSPINKYIGLDIEQAINYDENVNADYTWDGFKMPFEDNSFESSFGTEVLEHCPYPKITLDEVNRVLKPGGIFFFTVPFLWNLHEIPHDEYRYTPFALERLLKESNFTNIKIESLGGWHASMAQMLGLWVCRAPLSNRLRKILKILILPVYKTLLKKDHKPIDFNGGYMITGFSGVAYKPL
jgi:SAM-dependent methyltransferase